MKNYNFIPIFYVTKQKKKNCLSINKRVIHKNLKKCFVKNVINLSENITKSIKPLQKNIIIRTINLFWNMYWKIILFVDVYIICFCLEFYFLINSKISHIIILFNKCIFDFDMLSINIHPHAKKGKNF